MYLKWLVISLEWGVLAIVSTLLFIGGYATQSAGKIVEDEVTCGVINDYSDELVQTGKRIWNANVCGACHNKNMRTDAIGPALAGVAERWSGEAGDHLYQWIRSSQTLIESGKSERANILWSSWGGVIMPNYSNLTNQEIDALLAYIKEVENF